MKSLRKNWWANALPMETQLMQNQLLRSLIRDRVAPFSKFYRALFAREDIDPNSIRTTADLQRLPFTSKADLIDPKDFVLIPDEEVLRKQASTWKMILRNGPSQAKKLLERELRPIFMTSTTGRSAAPVPFLYTAEDIHLLEESGRRLMAICNTQRDYRAVNAFPFAPHLAFWQAHYASTAAGVFALSTGGGKVMGSLGNVESISKINPDLLIAMPTFLYHLLQQALEQGRSWDHLKQVVLGGEKVPIGMRRKLHEFCTDLGAPDVEIISTYAFTEAKMAWAECPPPLGGKTTGFHTYPDLGFIEIIDPDTGERVPEGHGGEIVYTALQSRGSVVLRYRTGDLIEEGLHYGKCPHCGRTCPRLVGRISRVSDIKSMKIDKLKGTLIDFNQLENILDDTDGLGAWQMELRKLNDDPLDLDEIVIHAVAISDNKEQLATRIRKRLKEETDLSPNEVKFHDWETLRKMQGVGVELKEKKVVDNRPQNEP
ncbi:phenylacetate--CoA ligase family protein [Persicirhabdus sediminis]|nr:AMP-binding protein [Persicirhabdus sediminis]